MGELSTGREVRERTKSLWALMATPKNCHMHDGLLEVVFEISIIERPPICCVQKPLNQSCSLSLSVSLTAFSSFHLS